MFFLFKSQLVFFVLVIEPGVLVQEFLESLQGSLALVVNHLGLGAGGEEFYCWETSNLKRWKVHLCRDHAASIRKSCLQKT